MLPYQTLLESQGFTFSRRQHPLYGPDPSEVAVNLLFPGSSLCEVRSQPAAEIDGFADVKNASVSI
jgi:hypothetical protein